MPGDEMPPEEYIRQWTVRIENMESVLKKHNQDLYEGDGVRSPSITARLFRVEDSIASILSNSEWTKRAAILTLLGLLADIISRFVK